MITLKKKTVTVTVILARRYRTLQTAVIIIVIAYERGTRPSARLAVTKARKTGLHSHLVTFRASSCNLPMLV